MKPARIRDRRALTLAALAVLALLLALNQGRLPLLSRTGPPGPTRGGTDSRPSSTDGGRSSKTLGPQHGPGADPRAAWRRATTRRAGDLDLASSPGSGSRAWVEGLFSEDGPPPIDPEAVQRWLDSGHTNASDLLALRQAGAGPEYLQRALKEFPNDPQVLLAAVALDDGPEAHRQRLERLKAADPENALANYLSAWNEFKAGNRDKALEELTAAAAKGGFKDFVAESAQQAERLLLDSGRSPAEAKALGNSSALLPHLAKLKQLSLDLSELQNQHLAAGDTAAAQSLARAGIQLGQHLTEGGGSMTLIGELVGIAIERNVLRNLDPNTPVEGLGGSPAEQLAALEQRRTQAKPASQLFDSWIRQAPDSEILDYFTLLQSQGERTALQWLQERTPPPSAPPADAPAPSP